MIIEADPCQTPCKIARNNDPLRGGFRVQS
jgi:hypothetical protein